MSKKLSKGRCVYCLNFFDDLNLDHVIPRSWFPENTETDLCKWTVPSCVECNSNYGKVEKELLIRFGVCLDPNDPASKGIFDKAIRSIDPKSGKSEKDSEARFLKKEQIKKQIIPFNQILDSSKGFYPNFGYTDEKKISKMPAILISKELIDLFCEKVVKGITYIHCEQYIEAPYEIETYVLKDSAEYSKIIEKFGCKFSREPGVVITRAVLVDDPISSLFEIIIWDKLKIYACVMS